MAITVLTDMTTISACGSTTGWSGVGTVDSNIYKEGGSSLAGTVRSNGTQVYYTVSNQDYSGKHLRFWINTTTYGVMLTQAAGGLRFFVYDGANTSYWNVAGSDTYAGGWLNICVDADNPDSGTANIQSIDRIGVQFAFNTSAKNFENTWVDYLRFGDYLQVTSTTQVGFEDIYADDDANGYGILEKKNGVYFLSGGLIFGDNGSTSSVDFYDKDKVLVYTDKKVNSTLYDFYAEGNATGTTDATFESCIIKSAAGYSGVSADAYFRLNSDDSNVDSFHFLKSNISGCGYNYFWPGTKFDGCFINNIGWTQIQNGGQIFNTTIANAVESAALYIDELHVEASDMSNVSFINSDTYDLVFLNQVDSTHTFLNFNHDGKATADLRNDYTSWTVTAYLTGTSNASTTSGFVTLINAKQLDFGVYNNEGTGLTGYEWRLYEDSVTPGLIGTVDLDGEESATSSTQQYLYNYSGDTDVALQIIAEGYEESITYLTLGNANQTLTINLTEERNI